MLIAILTRAENSHSEISPLSAILASREIALSVKCYAQCEMSWSTPKFELHLARFAYYKYVLHREKLDFLLFFSPNTHSNPNTFFSTTQGHQWQPQVVVACH